MTIKFYLGVNDELPLCSLQVDTVDKGYTRKNKDLTSYKLKGIIELKKYEPELVEQFNYKELLSNPFYKIEAIDSENNSYLLTNNIPYICMNITTRYVSIPQKNSNTDKIINTTFEFREYQE